MNLSKRAGVPLRDLVPSGVRLSLRSSALLGCMVMPRPLSANAMSDRSPPSGNKPLPALIAYAPSIYFACSIVEFTNEGTRIALHKRHVLPEVFYLINIPERSACLSRLAWRTEIEARLSCHSTFLLRSISGPALQFLKRAWWDGAIG
jgi:hypothetical protein